MSYYIIYRNTINNNGALIAYGSTARNFVNDPTDEENETKEE